MSAQQHEGTNGWFSLHAGSWLQVGGVFLEAFETAIWREG